MSDDFKLVLNHLKKQDDRWDKTEETLTSIDRHIIKQEIINANNDTKLKNINEKVKHIYGDYIGKKLLAKLVIGIVSFLTLFVSFMMWEVEHNNSLMAQQEKEAQDKEKYALSIPSPEQEKIIEELKAKLEQKNG